MSTESIDEQYLSLMKNRECLLAEPTSSLETVTPDIAREWLGHNENNRNKKIVKVVQYTRDIRSGNWDITGEAIKFSTEGRLLDGQNRLYAIIDADTPVRTFVIRGLSPSAAEVMDTGAPRRLSDTLTRRGYAQATHVATAINIHAHWKHGLYSNSGARITAGTKLTNAESVKYLDEHPDLAMSAAFASGLRVDLKLPLGAIATAHYELNRISVESTEEFFNRIKEMLTSGRGDPIYTLLKKVNDSVARKERIYPSTALFYLFKTWNARRAGKSLVQLRAGNQDVGYVLIPEPR